MEVLSTKSTDPIADKYLRIWAQFISFIAKNKMASRGGRRRRKNKRSRKRQTRRRSYKAGAGENVFLGVLQVMQRLIANGVSYKLIIAFLILQTVLSYNSDLWKAQNHQSLTTEADFMDYLLTDLDRMSSQFQPLNNTQMELDSIYPFEANWKIPPVEVFLTGIAGFSTSEYPQVIMRRNKNGQPMLLVML